VPELWVRRPVIAPLPAELLPLHTQHRGDEDGARLVEQPVPLGLRAGERRGRIEPVEEPVTVEKERRSCARRFEEKKSSSSWSVVSS
jgi:hypothetical protein